MSHFLAKASKLLRNPRRYVPLGLRLIELRILKVLARRLYSRTFFVQSQMEINPRSLYFNPALVAHTGGYSPPGKSRTVVDIDPWDTVRRDMLILLLREIVVKRVDGALAEVGVFRGQTTRLIHAYAPERQFYLFDTFEGFTERGAKAEAAKTGHVVSATGYSNTSVEIVRSIMQANGNVHFRVGYFPASLEQADHHLTFAFVHLDADLYEPTLAGLRFFWARLSSGGMVVVHDYNAWLGARTAVDEFSRECGVNVIPMPDKNGSALLVK